MNIIIAGDGEVGMHLAEALEHGDHNITIVDPHEELLKMIEEQSDLMTIVGDSTSIRILQQANVKKADLVIAVLHDEHINLLTGILAKKLGAQKVIVRVNTMESLSKENWRIYQNENPSLKITSVSGYTIKTVKITYAVSNSGTLTYNSSKITSGTVVNVNATSIAFGVGNTGSATNGQVRVTAIEVVYQKN